jgi:hypothetical protein
MSYAKPITIIVAGLICAHAASVSAHDLCFRYNNGGGTLVLKSPKIQLNCCPFTAEELNTCAPLNGFESLNGFNLAGAVTGTGCLDAQGNHFSSTTFTTTVSLFPSASPLPKVTLRPGSVSLGHASMQNNLGMVIVAERS